MSLRKDVDLLIGQLVKEINPYQNTYDNLNYQKKNGKLIVIAIGKAAYDMGKAAYDRFSHDIDEGIIITKYNHSRGEFGNFKIFEAGHPVVDENSLKACDYVLDKTSNLNSDDKVILLLSGGGSALFEKPLISLDELQDINNQLLKSGASINEINMIRKKLSAVKGGKFAKHVYPASIDCYILSDVIGNDLSSIASGPQANDYTKSEDIESIISKYHLVLSDNAKEFLKMNSINDISNVLNKIIGSVEQLCNLTRNKLETLGYETVLVQTDYQGLASDLGKKLGEIASKKQNINKSMAVIYGGESSVIVKGNGLGGRNQQLALAACESLKGLKDTCVFGFGSDGTDGPTDAAGGYVDENSFDLIGDVNNYLENNDSYYALKKSNGLIITGPTGSNVNDVYVLLIKR